jgi:hypothetical protein
MALSRQLFWEAVPLKRPIFHRKKVIANFSLGLNYCSIGQSRPPSRDTVPLSFNIIKIP